MVWLALLTMCGFAGYAALLPVVPLWAIEGGADEAGAGLTNFVLLATTVATQFSVPWGVRRLGWGPVWTAGLVLLGLPALMHALSADLITILVLSAARGAGFGIITVTGSAAVVLLVPPSRRGAAVGAFSLAVSVPNVLLMPVGGWLAQAWGFWPAFALGSLPLLGVPFVLPLVRHLPWRAMHHDRSEHDPDQGVDPRLILRRIMVPTLILLSITLTGGALITFAPQLVADPWLSVVGLLALGLTTTLTRWRVGPVSDRIGTGPLLVPFVLIGTAGMALVAWIVRDPVTPGRLWVWVLACALVGLAYGALQNLTMVAAFHSAGPRGVGMASTVWNAGFDGGTATGALLIGSIAARAGFAPGMLVAAALILATLPLAIMSRHGHQGAHAP